MTNFVGKSGGSQSYSIIIPTYGRPDSVKTCLTCCLAQSILPRQVVVVDASPNFSEQRESVLGGLDFSESGVDLKYLKAEKASSSYQRNQGIDAATEDVDIFFFIDDDSFMFPDCAQKVLSVYESDPDKKIAGVQTNLSDTPPSLEDTKDDISRMQKKKTGSDSAFVSYLSSKLGLVWKHVFLMSSDLHFIPYDGDYHSRGQLELKNGQTFNKFPLFHGCRMSFRAEHVRAEKFNPDLVRYCSAEDLDFSYRASRHGALVQCDDAFLCHWTVSAGRMSRYNATHMSVLNIAFFIWKNTNNLARDRSRYKVTSIRRIFAEFLKDLLSRRFSLPQFFGAIKGFKQGLVILRTDREKPENVLDFQKQFV